MKRLHHHRLMTSLRLTPFLALAGLLALACKPSGDARDSTRRPIATAATAERAQTASKAMRFVERFYAEYLPIAQGDGSALDTVLAKHPDYFAPGLLAALQNDAKARAAATGEIDGLDFDPFLNSQDPCGRYIVGDVWGLDRNEGAPRISVGVDAECDGKRQRAVLLDLEQHAGAWSIANVQYTAPQRDLLSLLQTLHAR